ncbi:hypothetical protein OPKNFCMD_1005 [Methylobacterium crusticola]|uniref:Phage tail collar domain-containing protein n=1 Tax=Methylobacterium crusticola TaxID=1697972 RepID=A0ABQ4QSJ8_9HYPH|nr:tail fiber protein [Methylobacterium crusticola]GJD48288.1 hypothetical protein OPKNFCMD_1005 [Methylobacterium crusticola]
MSEPFLGEIRLFGGNYAPRGWALCNGQLLQISQNTALFAILGTTFGGDGRTTFGLPDLQGRVPVHSGTGAGLPPAALGQRGGATTVTLATPQIPQHTHALSAVKAPGGLTDPTNAYLTPTNDGQGTVYPSFAATGTTVPMNPGSVAVSGGSQPHDNMQPYLCVTFIIALEGLYPARN